VSKDKIKRMVFIEGREKENLTQLT
jgi:hypothetical protein